MPLDRAHKPKLDTPEIRKNLSLDEQTIAEALKENGYHTFFAGKWHLGTKSDYWPKHQGFDFNKGGYRAGAPYYRGDTGYYSSYKNPRLKDGPKGEYLTDHLVDESLSFLENRDEDHPFFLSLWFYNVHAPVHDAKGIAERYRKKKSKLPNGGKLRSRLEGNGRTRRNQSNPKYASMVKVMDENVGRLLDRLKELDLAGNTYVFFTSDNGGLTTLPTKRYTPPTAVTPLRAGKGWAYEGGIRVPLIVRGPGIPQGEISQQPVTSMDYYPTMLQLLDLPLKPDQHKDGKNIVPYLKNPDRTDERTLVWHYPHYHGSS